MSSDKFNWKSLFVNDNQVKETSSTANHSTNSTDSSGSFPESTVNSGKFPTSLSSGKIDDKVLGSILNLYESGFDSLNQPGYDFYEFFKAIKAVKSESPDVYRMDFTMATSVDSKVTKTTLLTQAEFYIQEIEKVHRHYEVQGNDRKKQIQDSQRIRKSNLSSDVSDLEKQLIDIQNKLAGKKKELDSIDAHLINDVADVDLKIVANDTARTRILQSITSVVEGIKNNI